MRHVSGQDPAMLEAVINAVSDAKEKNQVDLTTFNYASLRLKRDSFWVVQLTQMGFGDPRTGRVADNQFPGSQPVFQIIICASNSRCLRQLQSELHPSIPQTMTRTRTAFLNKLTNRVCPLRRLCYSTSIHTLRQFFIYFSCL